jgi:hypothetical protein
VRLKSPTLAKLGIRHRSEFASTVSNDFCELVDVVSVSEQIIELGRVLRFQKR